MRKAWRVRRARACGAMVLAGVLALGAAPAGGAEERPAARPGDVVSAEPAQYGLLPGLLTQKTRAWRITYRSTGATGKANVVSGAVIVPDDGRTGTRPLVVFAPGTVGLADKCASSKGRLSAVSLLFDKGLRRGWGFVLTDYEGLGTPGDHTYLVGAAEGNAVLDAARAAQRLPQAQKLGISGRSGVGIVGYSQGGHAASWAAERHRAYAPELKVRGTAAGGVPADLERAFAYNDGKGGAGFAMMAAVGHDAAYPQLGLGRSLTPEGRRLADLARGSCSGEILKEMKGRRMHTLVDPKAAPGGRLFDRADWRARLEASDPGRTVPDHPVLLFQGTADELIPYEDVVRLHKTWSRKNSQVTFRKVPLGTHATTVLFAVGPVMKWMDQRLG
ncbi:lipase family protein [Streptomyces indicus]|uniref:Secretory lipase n=1 Tax=Streptomyces indicus TaxID=417292 RepID=A0A1G9CJK7_9ACTN|nr:lipase family protein [Streptomyces indicus]SDK51808.1 Secretory lipase [Streptomyces indicus]